MDGVAFFSESLPMLNLGYPPAGDGVCQSHHKEAALYRANDKLICRGCALLRQTYPGTKPNTKTRFGFGCYMLIGPEQITYWGNHKLPKPIVQRTATGALRAVVRDLILSPPEPPWLFIAFARSNSPERLRVNLGNDLIYFSGKLQFPGTIDEPPVERLNRKRVMTLHKAVKFTRTDWETCARAYVNINNSPDALTYLRDLYAKHPALAQIDIPAVRSPEYNALRLLAGDD